MFKNKFLMMLALVALLVVPALGTVGAQDTVNLVFWHAKQDAEGDALLSIIDAFQAANPGITIEQVYNPSGTLQDSFIAAAGAGEGPDFIIWANDSVGPWATAGIISDLGPSIDEELRAQATESAWGTFTFNDGVYGIPFSAKTLAFFYNKALVPEAPATWQDVIDASAELAQDGLTGLGFQNQFFHSAGFLFSLGGQLMDEDGNAAFAEGTDGAAAMDAYLQFHQDMYNLSLDPDSGVILDQASPLPGFQTGEVAMVYDGIWNLAQFESDLGDDLGVSIMPALDNGEVPALFAQTEGFFANAIAATEGGLLPVNPEVTVENPNLQVFADQFALGTPFPNRAELGAFWGPMGDAITAVGQGGETVEAARAAAYDLIQASIDDIHAAQAGS